MSNVADRRIRVGVSACLMGERVRYDAGHKYAALVAEVLARHFELVPVCPEVDIGMGVPRPPIHLVGDPDNVRAIAVNDPSRDYTDRLAAYGQRMAAELSGISGYVFKSKSPSCGLRQVKLWRSELAEAVPEARGIYAAEICRRFPLLPMEDEVALADPSVRAGFIERVYGWHDWQRFQVENPGAARLQEFHAQQQSRLQAHEGDWLRELDDLIDRSNVLPEEQVCERYVEGFMRALASPLRGL